MSNIKNKRVSHEFRTSRENIDTFNKPIATYLAPYSPLIKVRWFASAAGGVLASRQIGVGQECFAFVTRSQPYTLEFKPLAQYPDYRIFSAEAEDMPLWSKHWFDELEPFFCMFMYGPK